MVTTEKNKALEKLFIEDLLNRGNTDALADLCIPGSFLAGGLPGQVKSMKTAFPDNTFTIEKMLAEANRVAVQLTVRGTNTGPLLGFPTFGKFELPVPPTGKAVTSSAVHIFTIQDGKVLSITAADDQIGVLLQLGWTISPPT